MHRNLFYYMRRHKRFQVFLQCWWYNFTLVIIIFNRAVQKFIWTKFLLILHMKISQITIEMCMMKCLYLTTWKASEHNTCISLKKGDRPCIIINNCHEWLILHFFLLYSQKHLRSFGLFFEPWMAETKFWSTIRANKSSRTPLAIPRVCSI